MALGVEGTRVGCWTDHANHTGCTVVLAPPGAQGAIAVRGGAPGTREAAALGPTGNVRECHAIVLSGGSAFGLATADGVVDWCVEHGIGYDKTVAVIPIVGAAIVFDLRSSGVPRPGPSAGRAACEAATADDPPQGSVGVGAGCTVGKTGGLEWGSKGGQGWAVERGGGIAVGALKDPHRQLVYVMCDAASARTARAAASSRAIGAPNSAITESPMYLSMVAPCSSATRDISVRY